MTSLKTIYFYFSIQLQLSSISNNLYLLNVFLSYGKALCYGFRKYVYPYTPSLVFLYLTCQHIQRQKIFTWEIGNYNLHHQILLENVRCLKRGAWKMTILDTKLFLDFSNNLKGLFFLLPCYFRICIPSLIIFS